jgi:hypothetical protein
VKYLSIISEGTVWKRIINAEKDIYRKVLKISDIKGPE